MEKKGKTSDNICVYSALDADLSLNSRCNLSKMFPHSVCK